MGPKNISLQAEDRDSTHNQSGPVENLESPADEEQATAGASDPSRLSSTSSPRTGCSLDCSYEYSDASFVSHAIDNGSRKAPIHRRVARIFKRPYGSRITQNIRSLNAYPQGYGKLAAIEGCDPNFLIYRKFAWLHNRLLLHYQDELAQLEKQLEQLDQFHFREAPERLISRRRDDVFPGAKRKDMLKDIDAKLAEYDSLLLRMQQIQTIKRPTKRNQSSLHHLINTTGSVASQEAEWIHLGPDLVALAHDQEYGRFDNILEDAMNMISRPLAKAVFQDREQKIISGDEEITLLSPCRFDVLLRVVLTILAAALLLIPVLILFKNQPTTPSEIQQKGKTQILTVFFFTLAFSACCSIFTKAKRQEVFTATAAYCAVLVVFLGNTSNVVASAD